MTRELKRIDLRKDYDTSIPTLRLPWSARGCDVLDRRGCVVATAATPDAASAAASYAALGVPQPGLIQGSVTAYAGHPDEVHVRRLIDTGVRCAQTNRDTDHNKYWTNYAKAHYRTPAEQLEHDDRVYPGGMMCGFILSMAKAKRHACAIYEWDDQTVWDHDTWASYLSRYSMLLPISLQHLETPIKG